MRIKQLEYFMDLAYTNSLTRTAKNMNISIPSLSESIERLEKEVNTTLFIRSAKGYHLNKAGEIFLKDVEQITMDYQNALNKLATMNIDMTVHFGIDSKIYPLFFSRLLEKYQYLYREESVELQSCSFEKFKEALLNGRIDICYSYPFSPLPKQLEFTPIFENNIACVLSSNHPLLNKRILKVSDLYEETIYYDSAYETTEIRKIMNDLRKHGTRIISYHSPEKPLSMFEVEVEGGITIMHADKTDVYTGNMVLKDLNGKSETYGLIYRKDDAYKLRNLIKTIQENM